MTSGIYERKEKNRIIKICLICNKKFEVYPYRVNAKCCCRKCYNIFKKGRSYIMLYGEERAKDIRNKIGIKQKGRIKSKKEIENISLSHRGKSNSLKNRTYEEIYGNEIALIVRKKHSASLQGINLEEWKNFINSGDYSQNWNNKFKRLIRKRDNYICMICGVHSEKLNRALYIHHINYDKRLTIPENCISLCIKCHGKTNWNRKHWIKFFQSLLINKYNYKYENEQVILEMK